LLQKQTHLLNTVKYLSTIIITSHFLHTVLIATYDIIEKLYNKAIK